MPYPTQPAMHPNLVRVAQNSWYDNECRDTRRRLQHEVTWGICTQKSKNNLPTPYEEEEEIILGSLCSTCIAYSLDKKLKEHGKSLIVGPL